MNNQKTNEYRPAGLAVLVAVLGLLVSLASCSNPFEPAGSQSGRPATLGFSMSRSIIGTILPETITTADHYEVILTPSGGTAVTYPLASLVDTVDVLSGAYDLQVRAFDANGLVIGESAVESITIPAGSYTHPVAILPLRNGGSGLLSAVFTWPSGPASVEVEILPYPTGSALVLDAGQLAAITFNAAFPAATQVSISDLSLPSGNYRLRLRFLDTSNALTASISSIVQIYDNRRSGSLVPIVLSVSDLTSPPAAPSTLVTEDVKFNYDPGSATPTPTGVTPTPTGMTPTPTPTGTTPTPVPTSSYPPTIWISWTDNSINETGFRVYRQGESTPFWDVSIPWAELPLSNPAVSATFEIRSYNPAGESSSLVYSYIPVSSLSISAGGTISQGQTLTLTASSNSDANPQRYAWYSSNPGIASVDSNGVVQGNSGGTVTIYARAISGTYASAVVTVQGMVGKWNFEGGNAYNNVPGNLNFSPNSGYVYSQPTPAPDGGYAYNVYNMPASTPSQFALVNTTDSSVMGGDWTVAVWIKPDSTPVPGMTLFGSSANTNGALYITHPSASAPGFRTDSGFDGVDSSGTVPTGQIWLHLAWVKSGATITMYFNGAPGSIISNAAISTFNLPLGYLGARFDGLYFANGYSGYIDDLRIYNKALSNIEIANHVNVSTQLYGGGTGSAGDPYRISSVNHLFNIRYNPSSFYTQTATVFLGSMNPWTPIPSFGGNYQGNGFGLSSLSLTSPGAENLGIFSVLSGATVDNLIINSPTVQGYNQIGTLAGQAVSSNISNITVNTPTVSSSSGLASMNIGGLLGMADSSTDLTNISVVGGTISGNITVGSSWVGGIVGMLGGLSTLSGSNSSATVSNTFNPSAGTGGLVGLLTGGSISNSINTGAVTGYSETGGIVGTTSGVGNPNSIILSHSTGAISGFEKNGGLVGLLDANSAVSRSYATGAISVTASGMYSGGFVGLLSGGQISDAYASGPVTIADSSVSYYGGFVGYWSAGSVDRTYATGAVALTGTTYGGHLGSFNSGSGTGNFWDTTSSGLSAANSPAAGYPTATMQLALTYSGWDGVTIWNLVDGLYPTLKP